MKTSMFVRGISALALCLLATTALGSEENPVSRPFKAHGVLTMTYYTDGSSMFQASGQGTHIGTFITYVSGWDAGGLYMTSTAANGDQMFLLMPWIPGPWHLIILGGTGRFEHATGGENVTDESEHVFTTDQCGNTIETWTQATEGVITY